VLGLACTGYGASIALVTSDGVVRSSVLDRMFARKEDSDIRYPKYDLDREINLVLNTVLVSFRTLVSSKILSMPGAVGSSGSSLERR